MKRSCTRPVAQNPPLRRPVSRFKALLRHKMVLKQLNEEQTHQIAAIINDAVKQIEEVNTLLTDSNDE